MQVQVWDGKRFSYMTRDAAAKLVKAGTHEISTGKNANDLKRVFTPRKKTKTSKAAYKTREMRATHGAASDDKEQVAG